MDFAAFKLGMSNIKPNTITGKNKQVQKRDYIYYRVKYVHSILNVIFHAQPD